MTADPIGPICADCEPHDDGGFTCDPNRPACPYEPVEGAWPLYEYVKPKES